MVEKLDSALTKVRLFVSPPGGSPLPAYVPENGLIIEVITAGSVYSPDNKLCHAGWIFCHEYGHHTICESDPDCHYECISLHFDLTKLSRSIKWPRSFFWDDTDAVIDFAHEVLREFHHNLIPKEILCDWILIQLQYRLECSKQSILHKDIPPPIQTAVAFLEDHFSDGISLSKVAQMVELSMPHFHVLFKKHVGMSPHQYVINCRVREARQLLAISQDPIKAIAQAVGYVNPENFCRTFKKHTGTTAAEYRLKYAGPANQCRAKLPTQVRTRP